MKHELISAVMREMGRKGGKKGGRNGGRSRMQTLTAAERSQLARKAAKARWAKSKS